ncbi:molybdopterin-dependent oxidoreductase [Conexibacter sp. SYSU D00693]|uniref:molybdopterin-dependent oxidoreductase n=1 Tax=Conexibacter sp. SYSU D00693 TaxID=2812560 RepID=UPI00196B7386|nr:molybdopterin-dependent oxidoreductase [Conexibacter sp. SYSU D00693]
MRRPPLTPRLFGQRGIKRAEKLGIDPARLPPGQSPTLKFPLFTSMGEPDVDTAEWSLSVHGNVHEPFALRWDELLALPQTSLTTDLHCVTRWSKFDTAWRGVRVRDLLDRAQPFAGAEHALASCFDGYTTNLPLEVLRHDDVLIAWEHDGRPLPREHGGPARLLVPERYLWKSAKWIRGLEVTRERKLGFWERNGYHPEGDPWQEQRHW